MTSAEQASPPRKKKSSLLWRVVFVVALVVLIGALAALGVLAYSYLQGQQVYNKIEEIAGIDEGASLESFDIDWDALRAINSDIVAWVYIPGTNINYPVVKGTDNSYYLSHDFEGTQGAFVYRGTVFLDYENSADYSDDVNFMYGHHLNDGTMFSAISTFDDQATFDEHRTVYLLTPTMNYKLRSFSLAHVAGTDPIVENNFSSPTKLASYIQDKMDRSVVSVTDNPAATSIQQAFAFSTCDNYSSGRFILFCYAEEQVPAGAAASATFATGDDVDAANEAIAEKTQE